MEKNSSRKIHSYFVVITVDTGSTVHMYMHHIHLYKPVLKILSLAFIKYITHMHIKTLPLVSYILF